MTSPASASDRQSQAFDLLAEPIRRWIWQKGWTSLRDIQERAIPYLIDGNEDLIITAATAGGKTEAAFLPLISRAYTTATGEGFDLVYVGPLRALINDQFRRLEDLCEALDMPVHPWHGDVSQAVKTRARKNPRGNPADHSRIARSHVRPARYGGTRLFADTQAIVIDELHALLDSERGVHLRSLLTRLELSVGRRIRRVGLSATLGDMALANAYLRPEAPEKVGQLVSRSDGQELRIQLRAYIAGRRTEHPDPEDADPNGADAQDLSATRAVGEHIFDKLRGHNNLVFAGSRGHVELYSDLLRGMCEERHLPNEFFPHHASLSREHRGFVEKRLKDGSLPVTAICTSTLELGIDIGDVACVGQIGAPWSVAALRQRLGRSGAPRRTTCGAAHVRHRTGNRRRLASRRHPASGTGSLDCHDRPANRGVVRATAGRSTPSLDADASNSLRNRGPRGRIGAAALCDPLRPRPVSVGRAGAAQPALAPAWRPRHRTDRTGRRTAHSCLAARASVSSSTTVSTRSFRHPRSTESFTIRRPSARSPSMRRSHRT